MAVKQLSVTTAMGKRLIGKAMAAHPAILEVLKQGTLVIIAGTTNGYVAEEVLAALGQADEFSREGFRRGVTVPPDAKAPSFPFPGDVVLVEGRWHKGLTVMDVADALKEGDVVLKGANAFDACGKAAVQIGHPRGGTILAALPAVIGSRVRLIIPVGLEKRVFGDVDDLVRLCNLPGAEGPRLCPLPGQVFTELDALSLLTGAEASLIAAGGIYGAEGAAWIGVRGTDSQIDAAEALVSSVSKELPCRV
jgi:hypothetical protein